MFSRPVRGWTHATIADFKCVGCYYTDIPHDVLCSAKAALEHDIPFVLYLDEGQNEVFIFSYYERTYVVRQVEPPEFHIYEIDFRRMISDIMHDFMEDIYDWSSWAEYELTDEEVEENKVEILKQMDEIREFLISKSDEYEDYSF